MSLLYDSALLLEPWQYHWLSLLLGLLGLACSTLSRSSDSIRNSLLFSGVEISWVGLVTWALQNTCLIYSYSESPHLMNNLGGLLATSQEMLGSFSVLGFLIVASIGSSLIQQAPAHGERIFRSHTGVRSLVISLIVLQVILNWLVTEIGWWGFALEELTSILSVSSDPPVKS